MPMRHSDKIGEGHGGPLALQLLAENRHAVFVRPAPLEHILGQVDLDFAICMVAVPSASSGGRHFYAGMSMPSAGGASNPVLASQVMTSNSR